MKPHRFFWSIKFGLLTLSLYPRLHNKFPIELALYGHEHHEDLYLSKNTLYHIQAPLFDREFTLFSIINETSLTIDSQTFNFELLPYIPPEPVDLRIFLHS